MVLDISKTLMYDYHYNTMEINYKKDINLMYTDTGSYFIVLDSLVYHVKTKDFYDDLLNSPNLLARIGLSNLPRCFT